MLMPERKMSDRRGIAQQNNVTISSNYRGEYFRIWPKICQPVLNIVILFNLYFDIFSARPRPLVKIRPSRAIPQGNKLRTDALIRKFFRFCELA